MLYAEQLFSRPLCSYCQVEIPGMGIECADCTHTPTFRMCTDCFALGAEIGQHKADHRYRFFDSGSLVIFPNNRAPTVKIEGEQQVTTSSNWSAREEARILDALEQYGFGNWQDIAKHVETKTPQESKDEYVSRFVNGALGQNTWTACSITIPNSPFSKNSVQRPIDHTKATDDSPLSPSLTSKLPPLDISSDEMQQLGYMPDRDDYEKEFDNDSERLVSQLVFTPEDEEVDIALKLALVDMYSRRLRERVRRKRVIRDYQLVSQFFKKDRGVAAVAAGKDIINTMPPAKRRFVTYERELCDKLKPFSQFFTAREKDVTVQNLVKEKELKFRMQELYKYRRNGVVREDDCIEYERHKQTLLRRRRAAQKGTPDSAGPSTSSPAPIPEEEVPTSTNDGRSGSEEPLNGAVHGVIPKKEKLDDQLVNEEAALSLEPLVQANLPSPAPPAAAVAQRKNDDDVSFFPDRSLTLPQSFCDDINSNFGDLTSEVLLSQATGPQRRTLDLLTGPVVGDELYTLSLSPLVGKQKDLEDQSIANFHNLPQYGLLSVPEIVLCCRTQLLPSQYLMIKTALIINPEETITNRPDCIDESSWKTIVDYLHFHGYFAQFSYSVTEDSENCNNDSDSDDGSSSSSSSSSRTPFNSDIENIALSISPSSAPVEF